MLETGRRLARALRFAFTDPAWPRRYGLAALVLLIPGAGAVALLGWQRRVYDAIRRGEPSLPRVELRGDLRRGVPTLVNLAIFFGVPLLCAGLASPRRVVQDRPGFLVDATAWLLTILVFAVAPEILRRALGAGEALALLRPGPSVIVVRRRPAAYIVSALALSAVWLVGLLGSALSHGVGALILGPLGLVVLAHTTSAWQHDVDASAPAAAPPQTPPPTPTQTPPETPTDAPTDAPTDTPAAS